jgi:hypothetical protein
MLRSEINSKLRNFARTLSPTDKEQKEINKIYASLCELLGDPNCIQIGSYPRFTAITPMHDLDIIYCLGEWDESHHEPEHALAQLLKNIRSNYKNPAQYSLSTDIQNHSVVLVFKDGDKEIFSIDVVPCYSFSQNEFGDPMYMVPEVIKEKKHEERRKKSWDPKDSRQWIKSDPRGYISQATAIGSNSDFRKAVKIAKFWKTSLRENIDDNLKLKSFHIEQVITNYFKEDTGLDLMGGIFKFFYELPDILDHPNAIEDRAQEGKYIDDYLRDLTQEQKQRTKLARDNVLALLEDIEENSSIINIFTAKEHKRSPDEKFIFDHGILMCHDPNSTLAEIRCDDYASRSKLRGSRHSPNDEKLYFKLRQGTRSGYQYYWKVKNSTLLHPSKHRGDITLNQTRNYPETTKYIGLHFVECYAVNTQGECESRHQYDVSIEGN